MDVAGLSMTLAQINLQTDVGTAMLSKTMDTNEELASGIVNMIDRSSMERSVNPEIGSLVDVRV